MPDEQKLAPCPFCGGTNVKTFGPYGWYSRWGISHSCKTFYSGTQELAQGFRSEAEAVAAWNTRIASTPSTTEPEMVEAVAQFLHDEGGFDEAWHATWPEHPDDTGQREGGFVRIVPSDVQEKFRDIARRLCARYPTAIAPTLRAQQAEVAALREALRKTTDALVRHHQWHAAQTDPDPEYGFIPADEYVDSSMYGQTVEALSVANPLLADGPVNQAADALASMENSNG